MEPTIPQDTRDAADARSPARELVSGPTPTPGDLVAIAQGLSCWLWGIPAAMLLSIRELPFDWAIPFDLPLFIAPYLLVLAGCVKMTRVASPGSRWRGETRRALAICGLALYLAPFLYWWRRWPESAYLMANVWLLTACGIAFLAQVNRVVRPLGGYFGDPALAAESELFRAVVWIVLGLPVLAVFLYVVAMSARQDLPVTAQFADALVATPAWALSVLLVPLSITLALVWRAKDLALAHLKSHPLP